MSEPDKQEVEPRHEEEMREIPDNLKQFVIQLAGDNKDVKKEMLAFLASGDEPFFSEDEMGVLNNEDIDFAQYEEFLGEISEDEEVKALLVHEDWTWTPGRASGAKPFAPKQKREGLDYRKKDRIRTRMEELKKKVFDKMIEHFQTLDLDAITAEREAQNLTDRYEAQKARLEKFIGDKHAFSPSLQSRIESANTDLAKFTADPTLITAENVDNLETTLEEIFQEFKKSKIEGFKDKYPDADASALGTAETLEQIANEFNTQRDLDAEGIPMNDYKEFLGSKWAAPYVTENLDGNSRDALKKEYDSVKRNICERFTETLNSLGADKISPNEIKRLGDKITNASDEIDPDKFEKFCESFEQDIYDIKNPAKSPGEEITEQLKSPLLSTRWAVQQIKEGNWMAGIFVAIFKFASTFDYFGISARIANGASRQDWEEAGFERHLEITGERKGNPSLNHMGAEQLANYRIQHRDKAENYLRRLRIDEDLHFGDNNVLMGSLLASTFTVDKLINMADDEGNIDETSLPPKLKSTKGTLENLWAKVHDKDPAGEYGNMRLAQFISENLAEEGDAVAETEVEEEPEE